MSGSGPIYEYQREVTERLEQAIRERDEARTALIGETRVSLDFQKQRDEARAEVERLKADLDVVDSDLQLAVKRLTAEVERLRGAKPELPPRPPFSGGLPRYGLRWNGPVEPIAVPMDDGYWTPWHLADAAYQRGAEAMREAAAQAVKHLSHEDGMGMGSQRIESVIRALPIPEDDR